MATLAALLSAYDLGSGDVIHVDAGTYQLVRSALITAQDSGVRIEGPTTAAAVLNRGNTSAGSYDIELLNADGVTIERLSATGGLYGIYAGLAADSDYLTLRHIVAFGNLDSGVRLEYSNDHATIVESQFHSQQRHGIYVDGDDALVAGNTAFNIGNSFSTQGSGISVRGSRSVVENNEAHSNWDG